MAFNFVAYEPDQQYLMPPNLRDWLPDGHLALFIVDAVDQIDLRSFYAHYRQDGWGRAAYDPKMMVTLLLYAYCLGERSSRRIERHCQEDIAFRVITANQLPDHATIARFRQIHEKAVAGLFQESLRLCAEAGLVKLGTVALDGTKMKANASLAANRTAEGIEREIERIVRQWLEEAKAVDAAEDERYGPDHRGDELPEELRDRHSRLARLKVAKARLDAEERERQQAYEEHLKEREAKEAASGKRLRGRKPKAPDPEEAKEARANITDPDSRIMKTRSGAYIQGYNGQAVVTEEQIIVAADVTQEANDVHQLHPMLEEMKESLDEAGIEEEPEVAIADTGYLSEENLKNADPEGPELLIATAKDWKVRQALADACSPDNETAGHREDAVEREDGSDPALANEPAEKSGQSEPTLLEAMEAKLSSERGRELYPKRGQTVEPVIGQIKSGRGCDGFMRRGLKAAKSEWKLLCATHNLLKLWRSVGRLPALA